MKKLQFCLVLLSVLLVALGALAQIQNGQFNGTVTDPSGAAIPNAKVTVTNVGTNLSVSTTTNQSGAYTVKELPPGSYKITVEAPGFKTQTDTSLVVNAGVISRADFKLTLGQTQEVVEVTGEQSTISTEDSKLSTTVSSTQINNLPLNGHNVYDLMQLAPGAVNVKGVDMENGHFTVVNGLREDFNGFMINGVANKGLSGGVNNTPIQDTVQEFQQLQLNVSAQYGNSAGSINNLVSKSGTNAYHGSVWEYARNSVFDANDYFSNQAGIARLPLHFNQFGGTVGGPIVKDKLFFFASYQGDRFLTNNPATPTTVESPEFRQAVETALPNSVAALLYKDFPASHGGTPIVLNGVLQNLNAVTGGDYTGYLCPDNNSPLIAGRLQQLLGVTAADQANAVAAGCSVALPLTAGAPGIRTNPYLNNSATVIGSQSQPLGNLFNGNEASGRIDYNWNANNRTFVQFNWLKSTDKFGPCLPNCDRGFSNPTRSIFPNGQFSYVHTFSPTILNEVRLGYTQNNVGTSVSLPGVPQVGFDDGTLGFGSYNGYPQFFKEHDYSYGDMVSISHGNHNIKTGVDFKRNIENSEFDIARGSYYFFDSLYFAADSPYTVSAGVNPGFATGQPGALGDNVRHWRNLEF
jgi:hypothetical protein